MQGEALMTTVRIARSFENVKRGREEISLARRIFHLGHYGACVVAMRRFNARDTRLARKAVSVSESAGRERRDRFRR